MKEWTGKTIAKNKENKCAQCWTDFFTGCDNICDENLVNLLLTISKKPIYKKNPKNIVD